MPLKMTPNSGSATGPARPAFEQGFNAQGEEGTMRSVLLVLVTVALTLMSVLPGLAQEEDRPTVAILRFGDGMSYDATEAAILDVLQSYGLLSEDENNSERLRIRITHPREEIQGERLNIIWGDAGFDLASANLMVENALDREVDVIVSLTTAVTQIAVDLTAQMDEPTPVFFTSVYNPFKAGIAESACIKPAHVTGSETHSSMEDMLALMLLQDPDLQTVGAIYHSSEIMGVLAADELAEAAAGLGVGVEEVGITNLADIRPATLSLLERGAGALVPLDLLTARGLPIVLVLANQAGVPVFYPSTAAIYLGATVASGNFAYYKQGVNVGVMLAHHLLGELDIASSGINVSRETAVGLNLDSAAMQDVEIVPELREMAEAIVVSGRLSHLSERLVTAMAGAGVVLSAEERRETDQAFLEGLHCSPERIAEEQAALDESA